MGRYSVVTIRFTVVDKDIWNWRNWCTEVYRSGKYRKYSRVSGKVPWSQLLPGQQPICPLFPLGSTEFWTDSCLGYLSLLRFSGRLLADILVICQMCQKTSQGKIPATQMRSNTSYLSFSSSARVSSSNIILPTLIETSTKYETNYQ